MLVVTGSVSFCSGLTPTLSTCVESRRLYTTPISGSRRALSRFGGGGGICALAVVGTLIAATSATQLVQTIFLMVQLLTSMDRPVGRSMHALSGWRAGAQIRGAP